MSFAISLQAAMQFWFDVRRTERSAACEEIYSAMQAYLDIAWERYSLGVTIGQLRWFWDRRMVYPLANMYFAEGAPEPMTLSFLYYAWFRGHLLMPSSVPEATGVSPPEDE